MSENERAIIPSFQTETSVSQPWRFCVAPMMDWTDTRCRYFHRLLSRKARLYTEMVTSVAIIRGNREKLLGFDPYEQPVAVQLGGSDPRELAEAASIAEDFGYAEINLNIGCPSERVQSGAFGACLMREPDLVAECVSAMKSRVSVPVTVKCRIGVDDQDPEIALNEFADKVIAAGTDALFVHARKAWLKGLSPRENRDIPPLDYGIVHALKQRLAHVPIIVNGGLVSLDQMDEQLRHVDGVMVGRAAYQEPYLLLDVDEHFFGETAPVSSLFEAVERFLPYVERELEKGVPLNAMTRHILGLFNGRKGARAFRRHLATEAVKAGAGTQVLRDALAHMTRATLEAVA